MRKHPSIHAGVRIVVGLSSIIASVLSASAESLAVDFATAQDLTDNFHVFGGSDLPTWSDQPGVGGVSGRVNVNGSGTRTLWTKASFPLPAVTSGYVQSVFFRTDPAPSLETDPVRLELSSGTADGGLVVLGVPSVGISLHTAANQSSYRLRLNRRLADNHSWNKYSADSFQLSTEQVYELEGRFIYSDGDSSTYTVDAALYARGGDGTAERTEVLRWTESITNADLAMNGFLVGQIRAVRATGGGLHWFDDYRIEAVTLGPPPPAPVTIDAWREAFFTEAELDDPEMEDSHWGDLAIPPKAGGVPLLVHYFLGTDPRAGVPVEAKPVLLKDDETVTVRYQRSRSASSAQGRVEWSEDLKDWHREGIAESVVAWHTSHETIEATMPGGGRPNLFFRLFVERTDLPLPGSVEVESAYSFVDHHEEHLFIGEVLQTGETVYFTTTENIRHGHGQGENFVIWQREGEDAPVRLFEGLLGNHMPAMITLLEHSNGELHVLYVDRRDENQPNVNLIAIRDGVPVTLFHFDHTDGNVLNPVMTEMPDGRIFVLIPDRNANNRVVRRFVVDPSGAEGPQRLANVPMPAVGARIWDIHQEGNRLIVPVGLVERLEVLVIDYSDFSYTMHTVDTFASKSSEPPRNIDIFELEGSGQYVLGYLRPAPFSDRFGAEGPRTGLVGSMVLNTIDAVTFESVALETIAGFEAERAATHNFAYAQVGPRDILLAHTEVDRIHQRHLTGEYKNYVGGFLSAWRLDAAGQATKFAETEIEPNWFGRFVRDNNGRLLFIYNIAEPGDPLRMDWVEVDSGATW